MKNQARSITTNQVGIHDNLEKVVKKHLVTPSQKPFSHHTQQAFSDTLTWLGDCSGTIILDSCCGVGESTARLAQSHPNSKVIGVDKSAARTNKHNSYATEADNYIIVRADLNDFLRLLILEKIKLHKHFIFYPNPYPKSAQLQKRWYASSSLPNIIKLGGQLEVRSNWQLYIEEFSYALQLADVQNLVEEYRSDTAMTPFERKYWDSDQTSWRMCADLG